MRTKSKCEMFDAELHRSLLIPYCSGLREGAVDDRNQSVALPLDRKGKLARVSCKNLDYELIKYEGTHVIWTVRWSPLFDSFVAVASDGHISCRSSMNGPPLWNVRLPKSDRSSSIEYCGDGSLLVVCALGSQSAVVLDASNGKAVRRINGTMTAEAPLHGSRVMMADGHIVDLANGAVDSAINHWQWWRKAGV